MVFPRSGKMAGVQKRYINELKKKSELLEQLRSGAKKGTITLLFAARDIEHDNAAVLKELIEH